MSTHIELLTITAVYQFESTHWLSRISERLLWPANGSTSGPGKPVEGAYLGQPRREGRASSQSQSLAFRWAAVRGQRGTWPI